MQIFDLRVQLFYFPGQLSGCSEDGARVFDELVLPQVYMVRMNVVLGGDLVECLVFSQGLEGHRGFELVIDVSEAAARCLVDAGFAACLFLDSSRLNLVLLFQLRN